MIVGVDKQQEKKKKVNERMKIVKHTWTKSFALQSR